jgi:2-desacetyl-2-hydroxyethyl bacteriochlorophyllide A dehydrogenase
MRYSLAEAKDKEAPVAVLAPRSTMKAARTYAPGDMRWMDVARPVPGPREVLCRVQRVGICATDTAIYSGQASFVKSGAVHFPLTQGHEWAGEVAEVGDGVERFTPGDRVVGETGVACGHCPACLDGRWPRCEQARSVGTVNAVDGAFADFILMPERHLHALPLSVSLDNAALVEPAATALYAVHKAGVRIGETVLVQGSGPIGILAAVLAKRSGAARVFITGRKEAKLRAARAMGADAVIDTTKQSAAAALHEHTATGRVDRLIEASGSASLFRESLGLVEPGGVIAAVAFYDGVLPSFDIDAFMFADVSLVPVGGSPGMYPAVLALMASGDLDATPLITERVPLPHAPDMFARFDHDAAARLKVMMAP